MKLKLVCSLSALLALAACAADREQPAAAGAEANQGAASVKGAVAVVRPTGSNKVSGVVRLTETGDGKVMVVADIEGLEPSTKHGFHIHELGDCSAPDGSSAGGHYNPGNHPHALPDGAPRHAGDLGNLESDASGKAHLEITSDAITLAGTRNPVLGRAIIVHEKADTGAQPTGDAGGRLGCGVIGIARGN